MATKTIATRANTGDERYRRAEQALWRHYGIAPTERYVELQSPAVRMRILDVGAGEPLLFVHGTVGPGAWPSLVRALPGYRCLLLDRPGWGSSSAVDFSRRDYSTTVTDLLRGTLDALAIDQATLVGGSIGNVWALRMAQRYPSRVMRVILLGGSPLVPEIAVPGFIRLIASPVGALIVRLPMSPKRVRSILTESGHGTSLAEGRIPGTFVEWRAIAAGTGAMRNERDMVRAIVQGSSFRPGLTFDDAALAAIQTPTLYVYGTADPVGAVAVWRRATSTLANGRLVVVDGAGHMPWFDEPDLVSDAVRQFMQT